MADYSIVKNDAVQAQDNRPLKKGHTHTLHVPYKGGVVVGVSFEEVALQHLIPAAFHEAEKYDKVAVVQENRRRVIKDRHRKVPYWEE